MLALTPSPGVMTAEGSHTQHYSTSTCTAMGVLSLLCCNPKCADICQEISILCQLYPTVMSEVQLRAVYYQLCNLLSRPTCTNLIASATPRLSQWGAPKRVWDWETSLTGCAKHSQHLIMPDLSTTIVHRRSSRAAELALKTS